MHEFALFLELNETVKDCDRIFGRDPSSLEYCGHITAGELRAAFGNTNPIIETWEAELEEANIRQGFKKD